MPVPKIKQRAGLKRLARIHFWVMFFTFVAYLGFGFMLGPGFFVSDITKKVRVLADDLIVVTAVVLGPPATPVVTATPTCVAGAPRIVLDWADDAATTVWDIERDSLPLSTGVTASGYTDTAVAINTLYTYVVTAYGPMAPGSSVSNPVSATTLDCAALLPDPTVLIETLGGENVATDRTDIHVGKRKPLVTGSTNIPYAILDIILTNPDVSARITANANGYFSWKPPVDLRRGNHILSVTATDPNDAARVASDRFVFHSGVYSDDDDGDAVSGLGAEALVPPAIDFTVRVTNVDGMVLQGDPLAVSVQSTAGTFPGKAVFHPVLVDAQGNDVFRLDKETAAGLREFSFEAPVPLSLAPGAYQIRVDGYVDDRIVSRTAAFSILAWPLIEFQGGAVITYPEVASLIGTLFFSLLSLFVLFLLLFVREYWMYLHSVRHITEYHLRKAGTIRLFGKEVVG